MPLTPLRPLTLDLIHTSLSETVPTSFCNFDMMSFLNSLRHFPKIDITSYKKYTDNVSYYMEKNVCMYPLSAPCTERIVGQAGKGCACAMDISWDELKSNKRSVLRRRYPPSQTSCGL